MHEHCTAQVKAVKGFSSSNLSNPSDAILPWSEWHTKVSESIEASEFWSCIQRILLVLHVQNFKAFIFNPASWFHLIQTHYDFIPKPNWFFGPLCRLKCFCFPGFLTRKVQIKCTVHENKTMCSFHNLNPQTLKVQGLTVVTLLFAAVAGDVTALHRHYLQVENKNNSGDNKKKTK